MSAMNVEPDDRTDLVPDPLVADLTNLTWSVLGATVDCTDADILGALYDAGLAWVHFGEGDGGLAIPQRYQQTIDDLLLDVGGPLPDFSRNGVGLGMVAPTIAAHGTVEQRQRFLRPLYTGAELWCQLFSEPGAGSDLAAVGTRAVLDGNEWIVNGQKVWTSHAHHADWAILLARTDPGVPKHAGITFFLCPMDAPGVEVRPLRQITGEAEFNEVFLDGVRIPDHYRLGEVGGGWPIAMTTLNNERVAIGGTAVPRESGLIGLLSQRWREQPGARTSGMHERLVSLWIESEVFRLAGERSRQLLAAGQPGPESAALKLQFARLAQSITGLEIEMAGESGLRYDDWTMRRSTVADFTGRDVGYRYLRAKGNSIEGGTSEILRNVIAERVLGLPQEVRADKAVAWQDLPK